MSQQLHFIIYVSLFSVLMTTDVYPCAAIPPEDYDLYIEKEEALIIWDGTTQRFIRRGNFLSDAPDFGFIVPTPTQPKLSEVDSELLTRLYNKTRAEVISKSEWRLDPISFFFMPFSLVMSASDDTKSALEILDYAQVAGMDAVVLRAENVNALETWLKKNNYPFSPALRSWSQHYIDQKWYLTAFKMAKDKKVTRNVQSQLIQLEFKTDQPFFPYREPEVEDSSSHQKRQLRIFMISDQPPAPRVGTDSSQWSSRVVYAQKGDHRVLFKGNKLEKIIPSNAWLSEIVDPSSSRLGDDELWLSPSPQPKEIRRPSITRVDLTKYPVPVDLIAVIGIYIFWSRRKKRHKQTT